MMSVNGMNPRPYSQEDYNTFVLSLADLQNAGQVELKEVDAKTHTYVPQHYVSGGFCAWISRLFQQLFGPPLTDRRIQSVVQGTVAYIKHNLIKFKESGTLDQYDHSSKNALLKKIEHLETKFSRVTTKDKKVGEATKAAFAELDGLKKLIFDQPVVCAKGEKIFVSPHILDKLKFAQESDQKSASESLHLNYSANAVKALSDLLQAELPKWNQNLMLKDSNSPYTEKYPSKLPLTASETIAYSRLAQQTASPQGVDAARALIHERCQMDRTFALELLTSFYTAFPGELQPENADLESFLLNEVSLLFLNDNTTSTFEAFVSAETVNNLVESLQLSKSPKTLLMLALLSKIGIKIDDSLQGVGDALLTQFDLADVLAGTDPFVQNSYGRLFLMQGDPLTAFKLFTRAAELGSTQAMANLGTCYADGIGTAKNMPRANQLSEQALKLGDGEAAYRLGLHYSKIDTADGRDQTKTYYKTAAEKGHAVAGFALAKEMEKAKSKKLKGIELWIRPDYKMAAERGHKGAIQKLKKANP
jgi:hypothetical protein